MCFMAQGISMEGMKMEVGKYSLTVFAGKKRGLSGGVGLKYNF